MEKLLEHSNYFQEVFNENNGFFFVGIDDLLFPSRGKRLSEVLHPEASLAVSFDCLYRKEDVGKSRLSCY